MHIWLLNAYIICLPCHYYFTELPLSFFPCLSVFLCCQIDKTWNKTCAAVYFLQNWKKTRCKCESYVKDWTIFPRQGSYFATIFCSGHTCLCVGVQCRVWLRLIGLRSFSCYPGADRPRRAGRNAVIGNHSERREENRGVLLEPSAFRSPYAFD